MEHFYLYLANILFVLTLIGLFIFLIGRIALKDGAALMQASLRSIEGRLGRALLNSIQSQTLPELRYLRVQQTIPETGLEAGEKIPLQVPLTIIGRSRTRCHIYLTDPLVSSNHLHLLYKSDSWWAEDQDSSNGTILFPTDGAPREIKDKPEQLHASDVLQIGDTRFELTY